MLFCTQVHNFRRGLHICVGLLIFCLSIPVVQNLMSPNQAMNTSYDRHISLRISFLYQLIIFPSLFFFSLSEISFRIVNTYGAFGSITKIRHEVVLEATISSDPFSPNTIWFEYEFNCKPGNIHRRPCFISPYHYRIDWLMWFAGFQTYQVLYLYIFQ